MRRLVFYVKRIKIARMNDNQLLRHARHIALPEIDIEGVEKLFDAHVLIIGAGGLGAPAALYLAASGVGQITLVDDDVVELSNLQRQIIHSTQTLGMSKVASAQRALHAVNPDVCVHAVNKRVGTSMLSELTDLIARADVVLDCSDNFATRQLINRVCVQQKTPLVSGAAIRFDGQLSVYDARDADSPCYACLFAPDTVFADEACATLGVFAPLVGIIGAMQAVQALNVLLGMPALVGQLLTLDARTMQWHWVGLSRRMDCSVCGV